LEPQLDFLELHLDLTVKNATTLLLLQLHQGFKAHELGVGLAGLAGIVATLREQVAYELEVDFEVCFVSAENFWHQLPRLFLLPAIEQQVSLLFQVLRLELSRFSL